MRYLYRSNFYWLTCWQDSLYREHQVRYFYEGFRLLHCMAFRNTLLRSPCGLRGVSIWWMVYWPRVICQATLEFLLYVPNWWKNAWQWHTINLGLDSKCRIMTGNLFCKKIARWRRSIHIKDISNTFMAYFPTSFYSIFCKFQPVKLWGNLLYHSFFSVKYPHSLCHYNWHFN